MPTVAELRAELCGDFGCVFTTHNVNQGSSVCVLGVFTRKVEEEILKATLGDATTTRQLKRSVVNSVCARLKIDVSKLKCMIGAPPVSLPPGNTTKH